MWGVVSKIKIENNTGLILEIYFQQSEMVWIFKFRRKKQGSTHFLYSEKKHKKKQMKKKT